MNPSLTMTLGATLLITTACATGVQRGNYVPGEAGRTEASSEFGLVTAHNAAVLRGDLPGSLSGQLTEKFSSDVPTTVNFAFNSSSLDGSAQQILRQQAHWIQAHPQVVLRIYGHTDKVGSEGANTSLGQRRAEAVASYLISLGVAAQRLEAVSSLGERQPLVNTNGRSRQNRRTVTEIVGFGSSHATAGLDGRYASTVYQQYVTTPYVAPSTKGE